MKTYHLIFNGRVQKVGFRYFVQKTAWEIGIFGWVRNNYDGSVETMFQGTPSNCRLFMEQIKTGPKTALVTQCQEQILDLLPFENFTIKG
ncbi:MAG: acylphosphatase [Spirochaetae bacterium HGW-Spirochaetae-6]|nr:MAG: acylphosphatase [Spirochaetae bacterium HGW-Spirochaetae-6]